MSFGPIQFGGLASGLDTNAIISALMALEARPIDALRLQKSTQQDRLSQIGTLEGLVKTLQKGGARVSVDPQSAKPLRLIVIQFLLPIMLLVCLFAFFTRLGQGSDSGGIAAFSNFGGKGKPLLVTTRNEDGQRFQAAAMPLS